MSLPKITESMIRAGASAQSFQRGKEYYAGGAIANAGIQGRVLTGECEGTSAPYYAVRVELDAGGIRSAFCTCPYEFGGYCKHVVALLLTYLHHPGRFTSRPDPADLLAGLDRDGLAALLVRLMRDRPELVDWVEAQGSVPEAPARAKKGRRKKVDVEVHRRQVRGIMRGLGGMRMSEAYWHVGGMVQELASVQDTALRFLDAGDAETALAILRVLMEEAGHGIEHVDDSDGELGGFVNGLGMPMAEAILSLDMSAVERDKLASELRKQARYLDGYGMGEGVHLDLEAVTTGWDETPARSSGEGDRHDDDGGDVLAEAEVDDWDVEEFEIELWDEGPEYGEAVWPGLAHGDLTEAKLNVLERQGRIDEYLELCRRAGRHLRHAMKLCDLDRPAEAVAHALEHLGSAGDALALAERLRALNRVDEAIAVAEHGLQLAGRKAALGTWLGALEEARGRTEPAWRAWLAAFSERPSLDIYQTLMRLAGGAWDKRRAQVMKRLRQSRDDQTLAEVLLFEGEWDEAIKVAERRDAWYPVIETVADGVLPHRPEWVIRTGRRRAEALIAETKSKLYPAAAEWLARVKEASAQVGRTPEWRAYLQQLKDEYRRRPALQEQLRKL